MKRGQGYLVLAMIVIVVVIFNYAIFNDNRFNIERRVETCALEKRDSSFHEQIDSFTSVLSGIKLQINSLNIALKEYHDEESRNIDTIKTTLRQIKKTRRQVLKEL